MRSYVLNKMMNIVTKDTNYDDIKLQEIRYGLDAIYLNVSKLFVFFIISALLNNFVNALLFLLFFIPLRGFSYGFHAKKGWHCWIISALAFIGLPLLITYIEFNLYLKILLIPYFFIAYYLWAPADTPKKPLVNPQTRKKLKTKALVTITIYTILIFTLTNISLINTMLIALIYQSIMINPLIYKLFGIQFNNYLYYKLS